MPVNRTLDDSQVANSVANVTYSNPDPNHGWASETDCAKAGCILKPDNNATMDGTWHYTRTDLTGGVAPNSFTLTFPGTAIYVYGVAFKKTVYEHGDSAITHLSFALDGQTSSPADDYFSNGTSSSPNAVYEYNTLVYFKAGLSNDNHTLQVALARGQNSTQFNAFIFDYANYTLETLSDMPPQSSPSQPTSNSSRHSVSAATIAGIALGALALLCLSIGILLLFVRRRSRRQRVTAGKITDLTTGHPGSSQMLPNSAPSPVFVQGKKLARGHVLVQGDTNMGAPYHQDEVAVLQAEVARLQAQNASYADALTLPAYDGPRR